MILLGKIQTLRVEKKTENGVYLIPPDTNSPETASAEQSTASRTAGISNPALKNSTAPSTEHNTKSALNRHTVSGAEKSAAKNNTVSGTDRSAVLDIPHILLPKRHAGNADCGDTLEVFVYKDSEDRPVATTEKPLLTLGEVARLEVRDVTNIGAFLDWGLAKDLFLPFKEQTFRVKKGDSVLAALYIDKSSRLCATMKLYPYLGSGSPYKKDDSVTGTVYEILDSFGAYVAVDDRFSALIPKHRLFSALTPGSTVTATVIKVQPDGRMELSIQEKAYLQLNPDGEKIYGILCAAGGFLPYHDKSSPELIKAKFGLSKNAFKRAIGHLQKEGKILIEEDGISLTE